MERDKGFDRLWEKLSCIKHMLCNKKVLYPFPVCVQNCIAISLYSKQNILTNGVNWKIEWITIDDMIILILRCICIISI